MPDDRRLQGARLLTRGPRQPIRRACQCSAQPGLARLVWIISRPNRRRGRCRSQSFLRFSDFGEFVGSIAVVVTLFYLAAQVRQNRLTLDASIKATEENTTQIKNEALARHAESIGEWRSHLYSNPEVFEVWHKGLQASEELEDIDLQRFDLMVRDWMNRMRVSYSAARSAGNEGQMASIARICATLINSRGVQRQWREESRLRSSEELLDPEFVRAIEAVTE